MPITFSCSCGKTLRTKDDLAGKRIKCPHCDAVLVVPDDEFETVEAFEAVDETPAERSAAEPGPPDSDRPRRKKKKSKKQRLREKQQVNEDYERWLVRSYWRKRIFRGIAFLVLGAIVIAGGIYMLVQHEKDINPLYSVLMILGGAVAVGRGLFGLFF